MQKLNIYLVEDNPLLASALQHNLTRCGFFVCGMAATYEEAVRDLKSIRPDLIISDIMLATAKTGIDLARYINLYLQIPIIFQSSVADAELINQAMLQKPICYLAKPITRDQLINAITAVLGVPCQLVEA